MTVWRKLAIGLGALLAVAGLALVAGRTTENRVLDVAPEMRAYLDGVRFVARLDGGAASPGDCGGDARAQAQLVVGLSTDESLGKSQAILTRPGGVAERLGVADAGGRDASATVAILLLDGERDRFPVRLEKGGDAGGETLAVRSPGWGAENGLWRRCP